MDGLNPLKTFNSPKPLTLNLEPHSSTTKKLKTRSSPERELRMKKGRRLAPIKRV